MYSNCRQALLKWSRTSVKQVPTCALRCCTVSFVQYRTRLLYRSVFDVLVPGSLVPGDINTSQKYRSEVCAILVQYIMRLVYGSMRQYHEGRRNLSSLMLLATDHPTTATFLCQRDHLELMFQCLSEPKGPDGPLPKPQTIQLMKRASLDS